MGKIRKTAGLLIFAAAVLALAMSAAASSRWTKLQAKYLQDEEADRLIFVQCTGGSRARVLMYKKKEKADGTYKWKRIVNTRAYIGRNGLGKQREGDAKTPRGTFTPTEAFGILPDPGVSGLKYTQLTADLYWSGESGTYNTMVSSKTLGHVPANSEHLISYNPHYSYALNMGYNPENIEGKGSALFLHCFGSNPYTGGCVAVSRRNMKKILKNVTANTRICIYKK